MLAIVIPLYAKYLVLLLIAAALILVAWMNKDDNNPKGPHRYA